MKTKLPSLFLLLLLCVAIAAPAALADETPAPPVITLNGGETLTVDAAFTFEDPGAVAADYLGKDLTDRIRVTGSVTPYLVGEYELTYTVTDDGGRTASLRRQVIVKPVDMPEVVMPPEKTIYLTFDDGPLGGRTEYLLNVLKKYDVKATFFLVGNKRDQMNLDLIARAYAEGHSIGVHSFTHEYRKIYASEEAYLKDFLAMENEIFEVTGYHTHIFRFPGGSGNTVSHFCPGIMTRLAKMMEDLGYRYFDWNVSSNDMADGRTPMFIASNICGGISHHDDYSIPLQHDTRLESVQAVEFVIQWGLENGYTFLPLDVTSPGAHKTILN